ncbi:MAG: hypothetical protein CFE21_07955 [Bacteroidetes bacterium B1(2017)]|nr:MAG: hypothetical protein CFE21_07955 [Bacteroidetes bacterium B1(2017)]
MAAEEYYLDHSTRKHQIYGAVGTTLVHALIFGVLVFVVLTPPDPPLGNIGLQVSIGEENMGGPANAPTPNPAPTDNYVPISEATDQQSVTSDNSESVDIKDKTSPKPKEVNTVKPVTETKKPVLELPKKPLQAALFTRRKNNSEGGYGDGDNPGNQGKEDGSEFGSKDGHGKGDHGDGFDAKGEDDIAIHMPSGRKVKQLPTIVDNSKSVGKVVVSITVNKDGEVIKAIPGQIGSNTIEPALLSKAKEGALKTRFAPRTDGTDDQTGTMTIIFRFKP